jgi:hypothetical protein
MANQPTSRQIRGQFDALRATRSFAVSETINISSGNYGIGRFFSGSTEISHPSWSGATDTFFIYIDENDSLVLNNTSGFPTLSTKIARIDIVSGVIIDIIDERPSINGLIDGYRVLFDSAGLAVVSGTTVQEAIESLDSYVASVSGVGQNITKFIDLDVTAGNKNGIVNVSHVNDSPSIEFPSTTSGIGKVRYSVSLPNDYVNGTNILVKLFWSPADSSAGNVKWRASYKILQSGELINVSPTVLSFIQASPGAANTIENTGNNLLIPSSGITTTDDIMIVSIEREKDINDTYSNSARLHLARLEYTGRGVT